MPCPLKGTERTLVLLALLKKYLDTDSHRLTRDPRSSVPICVLLFSSNRLLTHILRMKARDFNHP